MTEESTPMTNEKSDKTQLEELRKKRAHNNELKKQIEDLNTECYALSDDFKKEVEKNKALEQEIIFRREHLKEINRQLESLQDSGNPNSVEYLKKIKDKYIKKKLEDLLYERIPEINVLLNEQDHSKHNEIESRNEFYNLLYDYVKLINTSYEPDHHTKKKELEQCFKISKKSTFNALKVQACTFWGINDYNEYVICDDYENLIYNENLYINSYITEYSISSNNFRLVALNTIKSRKKFTPLQEIRMKEENKLISKQKTVQRLNYEYTTDTSVTKIRDFFSKYLGLKPYLLQVEEKEGSEKKLTPHQQAKNIETSFWMLFILLIFFFLTIMFIYNTRDVSLNNLRIKYVRDLFDNSEVRDFTSLYQYLVRKIGFALVSNTNNTFVGYDSLNEIPSFNYNIRTAFDELLPDWYRFKNITLKDSRTNTSKIYEVIDSAHLNTKVLDIKNSLDFLLISSIKFIYNKVEPKGSCNKSPRFEDIITTADICYPEYYDNNVKVDTISSSANYLKDWKTYTQYGNNNVNTSYPINLDVIVRLI
jgi:hypothetical protein